MWARRDALGEAVRPARVVGHVAADRARLLAARVGREVQAVGGDGPGEVEVEHARLDPRPAHAASTDRMRFIFVVEITTAPSGGTAPPASPVPEPRATNGTPWRRRPRRTPGPRRSSPGSTRRRRRPPCPTRRGGRATARSARHAPRSAQRPAQVGDEAAGAAQAGRAARRSARWTAHQDHPPGLDGSPSTSTSSPGWRCSPRRTRPVALGAQLALADAGAADLADGVDDAAAGAAAGPPRPWPRWPAPACAPPHHLALGVAGPGRPVGGDAADEPHGGASRLVRRRTARRAGGQPAALIIGESVVRATRCRRRRPDRLGRAEHAVEAVEIGARLSPHRAAVDAQLGEPVVSARTRRPRRAAPRACRAPAPARRRARERSAHSTAPTTSAARRRHPVVLRRACMRSATSCS